MTAALLTLMAGKPDKNWETTASDYTKVSELGKDDTELNFAWYSKKTDSAATWWFILNRQRKPEVFEGTSGDVDQDLTGDLTYEYKPCNCH